jgi:hypothetical protein
MSKEGEKSPLEASVGASVYMLGSHRVFHRDDRAEMQRKVSGAPTFPHVWRVMWVMRKSLQSNRF